jgi:hypothetical protein
MDIPKWSLNSIDRIVHEFQKVESQAVTQHLIVWKASEQEKCSAQVNVRSLLILGSTSDCRHSDAMDRNQRRRACPLIDAIRYRPTAPCGVVRTSSDGGCASATSTAAHKPSSTGRIEAASQHTRIALAGAVSVLGRNARNKKCAPGDV